MSNDPITIDTIIALFPQLKINFMEYVHTNVDQISNAEKAGKHTLAQKCSKSSRKLIKITWRRRWRLKPGKIEKSVIAH